jgi:DNA ligase-1
MTAVSFEELLRMQQGVSRPAPTRGTPATPKVEKAPVMLLESWDGKLDPTGWYVSEKYDGVRAWWNGKEFISRTGNVFVAPALFKARMPRTVLDGELWMGRRTFQTLSGVARGGSADDWANVKFMAFDVPDESAPLELRLAALHAEVQLASCPWLEAVGQQQVKSIAHLRQLLADVEEKGGEGLVIRRPGSLYRLGARTTDWLRVVSVQTDEAVVVGFTRGAGNRGGGIGALVCRAANGQQFKIGTGLKTSDIANPPPVGTVVTYGYKCLTDAGIPREPRFIRVRGDE